jgi:hypothetical protein
VNGQFADVSVCFLADAKTILTLSHGYVLILISNLVYPATGVVIGLKEIDKPGQTEVIVVNVRHAASVAITSLPIPIGSSWLSPVSPRSSHTHLLSSTMAKGTRRSQPVAPAQKPTTPAQRPTTPIQRPTTPVQQPMTPVQQPTVFSPPLAMQRSMWDSIVNGNFIDAKIFAFSRRSREPGRVDTPKALSINTHVLATACSYFRSGTPLFPLFSFKVSRPTLIISIAFDFSGGIVTSLGAELPQDAEPSFQPEEHDLDSDYDDPAEVPAEGGLAGARPLINTTTSILPERSVKEYVVKYTAYRTFVNGSPSLRCPLMDGMQPARDHLIRLFGGD